MKRLRIIWRTIIAVSSIVGIKIFLQYTNLEFLSTTPLHTGLLAGSLFVIGFILSSIHTDYKESEKMPVDLTTALESIYQDGVLTQIKYPTFDINGYKKTILEILNTYRSDLHKGEYEAFTKTKELASYFAQMETLGVPANYIVKLKQEQHTIVKIIQRTHYLYKIQPLPSAFILVKSLVYIIIAMLLVTKIGPLIDEVAVTGFISFIYIYVLQLIKVMDTPIHKEGTTQDDVSLFLLDEQKERLTQ
jgi:hypothetical protein